MKGYVCDTYEQAVLRAYDTESGLPGASSYPSPGPGWPEMRPEYRLAYRYTKIRYNQVTGKWACVVDDTLNLGTLLDATWTAVVQVAQIPGGIVGAVGGVVGGVVGGLLGKT